MITPSEYWTKLVRYFDSDFLNCFYWATYFLLSPPPSPHSPLILTLSIYLGDLWQWFLRYWTSDNKDNGLLRSDQQIWQTQWQPDHTSWDGGCNLPDLRRWDCESEEIKLTFTESVKLMENETIIVHRRENDQSTQNPEKRKHLQ